DRSFHVRSPPMNTLGFLAIPAEIVPEQEAVVSEGRRFTYAETLARVRRFASALARLGVGRGTRVAALDTNSHRYVEAYYAAAMLGAVFIPLNYRAKRPELEHMLRAGGAELADGTPRGAALLCVPLYHIAGATNMMTTLWTGRRLVLMAQFEPRAWLDLVEAEDITHAFLVPTMMKQLLDQPDLERRDLSSL